MAINEFPVNGNRHAQRDPARTRRRILEAAFKEFAGKGFAGARVDRIARRAAINKRMLYHYFGDKEGLWREVLRRKIAERQAWGAATPDDPIESLTYWSELGCRDLDWIRLLKWEALQFLDQPLIDEEKRRQAAEQAVARIQRRQSLGHLDKNMDARYVLLAMMALTTFPVAFPQLARLITGEAVSTPGFRKAQKDFLRKFAAAFGEHLPPTCLRRLDGRGKIVADAVAPREAIKGRAKRRAGRITARGQRRAPNDALYLTSQGVLK